MAVTSVALMLADEEAKKQIDPKIKTAVLEVASPMVLRTTLIRDIRAAVHHFSSRYPPLQAVRTDPNANELKIAIFITWPSGITLHVSSSTC